MSTKNVVCLAATVATILRSRTRSSGASFTRLPKSMKVARCPSVSSIRLPVCTSLCIVPDLKSASSTHFQTTCLK